jgi:deazaflavin-dependent oxidoreductase (nitroreductase family)
MDSDEKIYDSPVGNVKTHIRQYVETNGHKGHIYRGLPTLLLITRGRKSGKLRRSALIYGREGPNYIIVASNAGAAHHPLWYLNLQAQPEVEIQVGADRLKVRARTVSPEEKLRLWPIMTKIFKTYLLYQRKAGGRKIPVVVLEPIQPA